jgi:hypothetical protein
MLKSSERRKYIRQRDALIPKAVKYANKVCGPNGMGWSRVFHDKMNQLWLERGKK